MKNDDAIKAVIAGMMQQNRTRTIYYISRREHLHCELFIKLLPEDAMPVCLFMSFSKSIFIIVFNVTSVSAAQQYPLNNDNLVMMRRVSQ